MADQDVQRALGQVEGKLDGALTMLSTLVSDAKAERQVRIEEQARMWEEISKLQKRSWFGAGIASAIGFLLAHVASLPVFNIFKS